MKATEVQRQTDDAIKESFAVHLVWSAVAHGLLVACTIGSVWLWRAPTYIKSSYTVALVDAPLSLRQLAPSGDDEKPSSKPKKPRKQQAAAPPASKAPSKKPASVPMRVAPPPPALKRSQTVKKKEEIRKTVKQVPRSTKPRVSTKKRTKPPKRTSATANRSRKAVSPQRQTNKATSTSKADQAKQRAAEQRLAALRRRFGDSGTGGIATEATAGLQQVRLRAYQELVRAQVIDAWILPMPEAEAQKLQATALLIVDRDGQITRLELLKSSGNSLFDESLLRAIKQAAPLPTLPEDYGGQVLEVEMRFRANGA